MDSFLCYFEGANQAKLGWLREVYLCVENTARTSAGQLSGHSVEELALALVRKVQRTVGSSDSLLPLSCRLLSVSELVTQQRLPCFSHLTWSTAQYREWANEAEPVLPGYQPLPRDNLLLIGYLSDRPSATAACDGTFRVTDGRMSIHCKILNPSPNWLHQLMLFPSWNYIPQCATGRGLEAIGCLEISASPLPLIPDPTVFDLGGTPTEVMGIEEVTKLLQQMSRGGVRLKVCGEVYAVCPLLDIAGKSFFCFCVREGDASVPILVSDPGHLCWQQCVIVGECVCVSGLRVCMLSSWKGRKLLCDTPQSRLHPLPGPLSNLATPGGTSKTGMQGGREKTTESTARMDVQTERDTRSGKSADTNGGENLPEPVAPAKTKLSKMISYKGMVSKVLNAEAGLYEIDGTVGLCLAYQARLKGGCGLRPGMEVELHNVHFLYRPSPHAPPTMLCACLRSNMRVTAFSRLVSEPAPCPGPDSPVVRLLLERNLGVSQYLWLCHSAKALRERLCPRWVREKRVGAVAGRLLGCVVPPGQEGGGARRDIYREMLEEPHCCPLTEYCVGVPPCELLSVQDLCTWMETECWASLSIASLLPPSGPHLTRAELNPLLAWSVHSLQAWALPKPIVLVGVLEAHEKGVCVRLLDQTGSVECVTVERPSTHTYCAGHNTAWLGSLVCVQRFTLVMERFLQTDFPSWSHLDQKRYITHRHCRVYVQLCLDDLEVLSPSAAMTKQRKGEQQRSGIVGPGSRGREGPLWPTQGGDGAAWLQGPLSADGDGDKAWTDGEGGSEREESQKAKTDGMSARRDEEGGSRCGEGVKRSPPPTSSGCPSMAKRSKVAGPVPCVSVVLRVESKEGLTYQNAQTSAQAPGRSLCFRVCVTLLGEVQRWAHNPKNSPMESREATGANDGHPTVVDLEFVGRAVRWFPLLQAGFLYRLIAPHTEDPSILIGSSVPVKAGSQDLGVATLSVQSHWGLHTLSAPLRGATQPQATAPLAPSVMSVSEVLYCSTAPDLVSFEGLITQRITLPEEKGWASTAPSRQQKRDVERVLNVRLTVQDLMSPGQSVQVYMDFSQRPYTPGLIPGARVHFHAFQRKVSRVNCVYCRSVVLSCVTVSSLGKGSDWSEALNLPLPVLLLSEWALGGAQLCSLGRLRVHVACVLSLQLHWKCSLCGGIFKQDSCTQNFPACSSSFGIFQAEAKAAVEDGSGEALVFFSSRTAMALLALGATEWEGLQRLVRVRGHIRIYHRGRSVVSDGDSEDPLLQYLSCLCVSTAVCRSLTLTCELQPRSKPNTPALREESAQLKRIIRGDREFVTRTPPPLQLNCTELSEWEPCR